MRSRLRGPISEVFSAFLAARWSSARPPPGPSLHSRLGRKRATISKENPYWRKLEEMTEALLVLERTLLHGYFRPASGGDALAAFRDPQQLNLDLLLHPGEVRQLLGYVNRVYAELLEFYFALAARRQPVTTWPASSLQNAGWSLPTISRA